MAGRLRQLHGHLLLSSPAAQVTARPTADQESSEPVRVTDGLLGGHVHPCICVAPASGDVVVVYNRGPGDAHELLICRSVDKGLSWTKPAILPSSVNRCSQGVYPGALTVLKSGEIVLHWYRYGPTAEQRWQYGPEFCISVDDGHTFGSPQLIHTPARQDGHTQPEGRFPFLELDDETWVLPLYDRTVVYDRRTGDLATWGDGRNHGMVPLVRTSTGALISGAPQAHAPSPVGRPDPSSAMANGLRSTDDGQTWQPLHQLGYFGVCGYDLTVLCNGWIVHTAVIYVSKLQAARTVRFRDATAIAMLRRLSPALRCSVLN